MASFLQRQGSKVPQVPSFNDFGSLVSEDMPDIQLQQQKEVPPRQLSRSWSLESDEGTPRMSAMSKPAAPHRSSFSEVFTRALYEHMRGN
eukprot:gene8425-8608_t